MSIASGRIDTIHFYRRYCSKNGIQCKLFQKNTVSSKLYGSTMLKVCRVYFFDELVFEFLNNISSSTNMIWNHGRSVLDGGCQPWKFIAFTPDGMSAPAVVGIQTHYS